MVKTYKAVYCKYGQSRQSCINKLHDSIYEALVDRCDDLHAQIADVWGLSPLQTYYVNGGRIYARNQTGFCN